MLPKKRPIRDKIAKHREMNMTINDQNAAKKQKLLDDMAKTIKEMKNFMDERNKFMIHLEILHTKVQILTQCGKTNEALKVIEELTMLQQENEQEKTISGSSATASMTDTEFVIINDKKKNKKN